MGGVGDEGALAVEGQLQARQQRIDCIGDRLYFARQIMFRQRRQAAGIAQPHFLRQPLHRAQRPVDQQPDQQRHQRREDQQRAQAAQRGGGRQVAPKFQWLRHLDDAVARDHAVDAPAAVAGIHIRKPQDGAVRQRRPGMRQVERRAIHGPDLHHDRRCVFVRAGRLKVGRHTLVAQRQRGLA